MNYNRKSQLVYQSKEMKQGFSKWEEAISTSPSYKNLGHYKVLLVSDGRDNDEKIKKTTLKIYGKLITPS